MQRLGSKRIYLTGSHRTVERVVWRDDDDRHWIKWCGIWIQVYHPDGVVNVTAGWKSVEEI